MSSIPSTLERARLGTPVTRRALTMVPLHLDDAARATDYLPLADAVRTGGAKITEISEGGSVPLLAIRNDADVAVLILDGEELLGAKQNRIVNLSILVPAKTVLPIPVSCVERGRWSYRTRGFDVSPNAFFAGGRASNMQAVTMCMTGYGGRDGDQARVWSDVEARKRAFGSPAPTSAMKDIYEDRHVSINEIVAELAPQPSQAGAVFALGGRVVGMELFETPAMFAAYFSKVARSYALDALLMHHPGDFRVSDADDLLADLRNSNPRRFKAVGLGDDLRIDDPGLVGGALVVGERLVHLAAFRSGRNADLTADQRADLTTDLSADLTADLTPYLTTDQGASRPQQARTWWARVRRWLS